MNERKRRKMKKKDWEGKEIMMKVCGGKVWGRKRKDCKGTTEESAVQIYE